MKFTGEYLDPTGLYHLRARQYDPDQRTVHTTGSRRRQATDHPSCRAMCMAQTGRRSWSTPSGETFRPTSHALDLARFTGSFVDFESPLGCAAAACGGDPTRVPRPRRTFVHPIPLGFPSSATPIHPTAGLPGYPAIDFLARGGTPILAVQSGRIRRHSGRNPALGVVSGSVFGWSLYLRADSGSDYFYTHLGRRTTHEDQRVVAGQVIGEVGHWPGDPGRSHVHVGVSGGPVSIERLGRAPRVRPVR